MATLGAAAIMGGSSLLGGIAGGKGAEKAAKAQAAAYQAGINEQRNEFNTVQANNAPFVSGGTGAFEQLLRLLGVGDSNTGKSVNGNPALSASDQQAGALGNLKGSPLYTGAFDSGLDALNQSLAASGGLRGGNGALDQSSFGANLFNQIYQQTIGNLGSVAGIGQAAAAGTNSAAQHTGDAVSSLLEQQGKAQSFGAAAPYAAFQNILTGLGSAYGATSGGAGSLIGQPDEAWNAAYGW